MRILDTTLTSIIDITAVIYCVNLVDTNKKIAWMESDLVILNVSLLPSYWSKAVFRF